MNIELNQEAKTNIWLGKGLLVFGIGFNAFLGFTVGYALLAFATAAIVAMFDLAKVRMVRNAVVSWRMNSLMWFFSGAWVVILTAASITSAVMFYAYSMSEVAKEAHRSGDDVKIAQQAFETSQQQAKSVQGFDVLGTQQKITALESQAAAILAKPATNSSGRSVGNIGGRTNNCSTGRSFYHTRYANECSQYVQLITEAEGLRATVGTATTLQRNATQATDSALTALNNFSLSEGIAGIGVLANMWYPDLYATDQKAAEQKAFKSLLIGVALITELLATSLLMYGYLLGTSPAPTPNGGSRVTGATDTAKPTPAGASAFVGSGVPSGLAIAADKVLSAFGEKPAPHPTPDQISKQQQQANAEKWRVAFEQRGLPHDNDPALWGDASPDTINNILGEVKNCNAGKQSPEQRERVEALANGAPLHEPETSSQQPEKAVSKTVSQPLANGGSGLYDEWVLAVKSKHCKPSVKPSWSWIQKRIAGVETGEVTHDRTRITDMQRAFFTRAIADGLMQENPNWTNGKAKYIWVGGYS